MVIELSPEDVGALIRALNYGLNTCTTGDEWDEFSDLEDKLELRLTAWRRGHDRPQS